MLVLVKTELEFGRNLVWVGLADFGGFVESFALIHETDEADGIVTDVFVTDAPVDARIDGEWFFGRMLVDIADGFVAV